MASTVSRSMKRVLQRTHSQTSMVLCGKLEVAGRDLANQELDPKRDRVLSGVEGKMTKPFQYLGVVTHYG